MVDIITDLVNQIIVEEVIPRVYELSILNWYKEKRDDLERENYRKLKLKD